MKKFVNRKIALAFGRYIHGLIFMVVLTNLLKHINPMMAIDVSLFAVQTH